MTLLPPGKPTGLITLMPTRGAVSIETMLCLRQRLDAYPSLLKVAFRKDVVTARNELARFAREIDPSKLEFDPEFVLMTDDDAWWPSGHVAKAIGILQDNPDIDMVSCVYCARDVDQEANAVLFDPAPPVIDTAKLSVEELQRQADVENERDLRRRNGRCYRDYRDYVAEINGFHRVAFLMQRHEDGELVRLRYGGFHWIVMRRSLLSVVGDNPFDLIRPVPPDFPKEAFINIRDYLCEDSSFFKRVNDAGRKIVTEKNLIVGHVDAKTGAMYLPSCPTPYKVRGLYFSAETMPEPGTPKWRSYFAHDGEDIWKQSIA